jgi:uncharacterized protein (DUF2147 family)
MRNKFFSTNIGQTSQNSDPRDPAMRTVAMNIRKLTALVALLAGLTLPGAAFAADPAGTWLTEGGKSRVRTVRCGNALCGTIVWLKEPNDPDSGKPKTDVRNQDASRRDRAVIGVPIVLGMQPSGTPDKWTGEVYSPEDGKTYSGSLTTTGANELSLTGCVLAVLCKSQTWTRDSGAAAPAPKS